MAGNPDNDKTSVDRRGTSFLVPLGISVVFVLIAIGWVSMSGHDDKSTAEDVLTRPTSSPSSSR